jgi:chromosome partitioning protein
MTPLAGSIYHIPGSTGSASNLDIPSFRGVFAFANQKGGVGKTTTAVSLAACLADEGVETLIVDFDPQGNASTGVGIDRRSVKVGTYEVLAGIDPSEGIRATEIERLSVLPSTIDLAGAEIELVAAFARESKLRSVIAGLRDRYAAILIDSPPSLGLLTINALVASDHVIVPVQCEYLSLRGLVQLENTLAMIRENLNPNVAIMGILPTMFDRRTLHAREAVEILEENFGDLVFKTRIKKTIRYAEAPVKGTSVLKYDPSGNAANAYRDLAKEVLNGAKARQHA